MRIYSRNLALWVIIPGLFIPCHMIVAGYFGFTLVLHESVRPLVLYLSAFSFPDDNLSKYKWIFSKLGVGIDIMEIWFGIAK